MKKENPKITLEFLQQLATDLFFELDEQQKKNLLSEFDAIEEQIAVVKKIETKNVLPLDFPFDIKKDYLRNDTIEPSLTTKNVLATASHIKDDYIVINKVIDHEKD